MFTIDENNNIAMHATTPASDPNFVGSIKRVRTDNRPASDVRRNPPQACPLCQISLFLSPQAAPSAQI